MNKTIKGDKLDLQTNTPSKAKVNPSDIMNEKRFRSIIENSHDVFVFINERGDTTYASPSVERVLGYTPEEFIGSGTNLVHPEDLAITQQKIGEALTNPGKIIENIIRIKPKNSDYIWIESIGKIFYMSRI